MEKQKLLEALQAAIEADPRSETELAELIGMDQANFRSIKRGFCPNVPRLDDILRVLGLRLVLGRSQGKRRLEL